MRELGKFAALTAAITFVLFVLAVNLLEPGWDDQMLLGTALAEIGRASCRERV